MPFKKGMTPHNKGLKKEDWRKTEVFERVCPYCKNNFFSERKEQVYCNQTCYSKSEELKENSKKSELIKKNKKNKWHFGYLKENVSYGALHDWVRYHKEKTGKCEICETQRSGYQNRDFDLANISGEYKRDLNDFAWLCQKCHKLFDKIKRRNFCEVIGVEVKSGNETNKYLSKVEKEKCKWLLENQIFSKILIANKIKIGRSVGIDYKEFLITAK